VGCGVWGEGCGKRGLARLHWTRREASQGGQSVAAAERRGNNLKGLKDFNLKAKAIIWPWLSYTCQLCSRVVEGNPLGGAARLHGGVRGFLSLVRSEF